MRDKIDLALAACVAIASTLMVIDSKSWGDTGTVKCDNLCRERWAFNAQANNGTFCFYLDVNDCNFCYQGNNMVTTSCEVLSTDQNTLKTCVKDETMDQYRYDVEEACDEWCTITGNGYYEADPTEYVKGDKSGKVYRCTGPVAGGV